jgi:hypothetical protein
MANDKYLGKFVFTWLADGNRQRSSTITGVRCGGFDQITLTGAECSRAGFGGNHGQVARRHRRAGSTVIHTHRRERLRFLSVAGDVDHAKRKTPVLSPRP